MPVGPSILCPRRRGSPAPMAATSTAGAAPTARRRPAPGADLARPRHDRRQRVDGAEDVRLLGDGDQLRALGDDRVEVGEVEPAVVGQPSQRRVAPVRSQSCCHGTRLAWCSISVTHDLVALADGVPAVRRLLRRRGVGQRVGDEVDALGAVAGEDDLPLGGADERADGGAGRLVAAGRLLGELVRPAVRVRRCRSRRSRARRPARCAASARWPRSPGRPAASRPARCGSGSGSPPGSPRRPAAEAPSARPAAGRETVWVMRRVSDLRGGLLGARLLVGVLDVGGVALALELVGQLVPPSSTTCRRRTRARSRA
jgi:hypothetical protein